MVSINIKDWISIEGIISLLSGLFIVIVASKGLELMDSNPSASIGIIIGSIIGVTFFWGGNSCRYINWFWYSLFDYKIIKKNSNSIHLLKFYLVI